MAAQAGDGCGVQTSATPPTCKCPRHLQHLPVPNHPYRHGQGTRILLTPCWLHHAPEAEDALDGVALSGSPAARWVPKTLSQSLGGRQPHPMCPTLQPCSRLHHRAASPPSPTATAPLPWPHRRRGRGLTSQGPAATHGCPTPAASSQGTEALPSPCSPLPSHLVAVPVPSTGFSPLRAPTHRWGRRRGAGARRRAWRLAPPRRRAGGGRLWAWRGAAGLRPSGAPAPSLWEGRGLGSRRRAACLCPPLSPTRRAETSQGSAQGGVGGGGPSTSSCARPQMWARASPQPPQPQRRRRRAPRTANPQHGGVRMHLPRAPGSPSCPIPVRHPLRAGHKNRGERMQPPLSPPPHPSRLFLQLLLEAPGVERCLKSRSVPGTHHGCPQ